MPLFAAAASQRSNACNNVVLCTCRQCKCEGGAPMLVVLPLSRVPLTHAVHPAAQCWHMTGLWVPHRCPCLHDLTTCRGFLTLTAQVEVDLSALGDAVTAAVAACSDPDAVICPSLPQLAALLGEGPALSPGSAQEARQLVAEVAGVQQLKF